MTFTTEQHPGVCADPPAATRGFVFNHSMLRVKDPAVALDFYSRVLGMRVLRKLDFEEMKFSLYFLAHPAGEVPDDTGERTAWTFSQRGVLELTHNWGTEADPDFKYHDGNAQPQGFGHICIAVPDLAAAVAWFDSQGVAYVKRPDQGKMKDVAFIKDPDGYWIEIVEPGRLKALGAEPQRGRDFDCPTRRFGLPARAPRNNVTSAFPDASLKPAPSPGAREALPIAPSGTTPGKNLPSSDWRAA